MRHSAIRRGLFVVICACLLAPASQAAKASRAPLTSSIKKLEVSPEEFRIRIRALIRPTLGILEQAAEKARGESGEPAVRRAILTWKIETTSSMLASLLRNDPLSALVDSWGYAIQVGTFMGRPEIASQYGTFAPVGIEALATIEAELLAFTGTLQGNFSPETVEAKIRDWADRNPIEGTLSRRKSMDSEFAAILATASGGGALAALGNLEETKADVTARIDLYTVYLPRLARWEAELAIDDVSGAIDTKAIAAELTRFTRAADRLAGVAEGAPALIERERGTALDAVDAERRAVLDAIHQERIATLAEIEAMSQRLLDRSGGPFQSAVHANLDDLVVSVEQMRRRLIEEAGVTLNTVVDHAFVRGVELLLIAAALAALGVVAYSVFLRR